MSESIVNETTRRLWTNCESCHVTIAVEVNPEYGEGSLPTDPEDYEWFGAFSIDCPICDQSCEWQGSDPAASWEACYALR